MFEEVHEALAAGRTASAEKAEPKARELAARAERVESEVEARLTGPRRVE